jgi:hypothetical protein
MLTGQVNWIAPIEASGRQALQGNFAGSNDSNSPFALLFSEVMGLSAEGCSADGSSSDWPDLKAEAGSLPAYASSPFQFEMTGGFGAKSLRSTESGVVEAGSTVNCLQNTSQDPNAQQIENPGQLGGPDCGLAQQRVVNKTELSNWMDAHALTRSSHHCAMYCRMGLEAAGLSTTDRPVSGDAGDYGPYLLRHGAQKISQDSYSPQVGDVVVFDKTAEHPNGHIEMYDGHQWVSDFMQRSFSPYRNAESTPPYTIYRLA